MTDYERILKVIEYCSELGMCSNNPRSFSKLIGLRSPNQIYAIDKKRFGISKGLAEKITKCVNINKAWLLTGIGKMTNDNDTMNNETDELEKIRAGVDLQLKGADIITNMMKVFLDEKNAIINKLQDERDELLKENVRLEEKIKEMERGNDARLDDDARCAGAV